MKKKTEVTMVVTEEDYRRDLRKGLEPEETLKPGVHKFRRGGFLERHGLTPKQARQIPRS